MKRLVLLLALSLSAAPALAGVLEGDSPDPVAELNAFYAKLCNWSDGTRLPVEVIDLTHDGVEDYLVTYDVPCRGQQNAFAGTAGVARQIWVSTGAAWVRILDVNALSLTIETRKDGQFIVLGHRGDYCMTAPAAPCFLTLEFKDNQLAWAEAGQQHPSMDARLRLLETGQEEN